MSDQIINKGIFERSAGFVTRMLKNSKGSEIYEGVVVNNNHILDRGTIEVALIYNDAPKEYINSKETKLYKFHENTNLLMKKDPMIINEIYKEDDQFVKLKTNIIKCYLATPFSGSHQNSGWFICPPIDSRGIVLRINEEYIWLCGLFKPITKNDEKDQTFVPFPSNIIESSGFDFEETKDRNLESLGNSYEVNDQKVFSVSGESKSNPTLFEAGETTVTDNAKNIILLRTIYPGGDRIKNTLNYRDENGTLKSDENTKLKKEFDSKNYPTESIFEISGKRFWIHKATEWLDNKTLADFRDDKNQKIIGTDKLKELKWQDFQISLLQDLDKFPDPDNGDIATLETDGLEGIGFSINDISEDNQSKRNLQYNTADTSVKRMYHENGNEDARKIDLDITNVNATTINLALTKGDNIQINLSIDLDNNLVTLTNKKDSSNQITMTIDSNNNEYKIEEKDAVGTNTITLNGDGILIEDGKNIPGNTITLDSNGIKIKDKNLSVIEMSNSTILTEHLSAPLTIKGTSMSLKSNVIDKILTAFSTQVATGNLGIPISYSPNPLVTVVQALIPLILKD